jgi:hypothetical protein
VGGVREATDVADLVRENGRHHRPDAVDGLDRPVAGVTRQAPGAARSRPPPAPGRRCAGGPARTPPGWRRHPRAVQHVWNEVMETRCGAPPGRTARGRFAQR